LLPNFTGGKDEIWIDAPSTKVLKNTILSFYGRTVDEVNMLAPRTFRTRQRLFRGIPKKLCDPEAEWHQSEEE
jgi:hypothetical protein